MTTRTPARARLLATVAALLAGLVYLNALHSPFVYGDLNSIGNNDSIRHLTNWRYVFAGSGRVVVNWSYALDWALWPETQRAFGFHLTNLILHVVNVRLLFGVARSLAVDAKATESRAEAIAFVAAALFAVHPLQTESVGYINARAGLLCALFCLAGFSRFRRALSSGRLVDYAAALILYVLALGSKETAAVLPLVWLAYDRWLSAGEPAALRRRLLAIHLPVIGATVLAGVARLAAHVRFEHGAPIEPGRLLVQAVVIWRYLLLLVAPIGQTLLHPMPRVSALETWLALVGLLALAAIAFAVRRRAPLIAFGAAWFFLFLLPSSAVPLHEPMAEHRVYEASIGLFLIAAAALARLPGPVWRAAQIALLSTLAGATLLRNRVWSDPVSLWTEAVRADPDNWVPHYSLADAYRERADCEHAVVEYRQALARSPRDSRPRLNLGICLAALGREGEARAAFETAREVDPRNPAPCHNLGVLELAGHRPAQARAWFERALALEPRYEPARRALAGLGPD